MFTIMPKQDMIEKINTGIANELADIATIFPDLQEKVEQQLLWGIFSKNDIFSDPKEKYRNHNVFASLSYEIVEQAKQELEKHGEKQCEFFSPNVDKVFKEKNVAIYLDYEDCDVKVENVDTVNINKNIVALIAPTLPDSTTVFESLVKGNMFDEANRWLWEYMDIYDKWKYQVMDKLYDYVWQIGGHGRWIQNDYNDTYVAQANIEIGDAGSVFIEIRDNELQAYVDMY